MVFNWSSAEKRFFNFYFNKITDILMQIWDNGALNSDKKKDEQVIDFFQKSRDAKL